MSTKWNEGFSQNRGKSVPVVITDCSNWEADIPAESWSEGSSFNEAKPPRDSASTRETPYAKPSAAIAIQLLYSDIVDRKSMEARIESVIESIKQLDPSLDLEYDEERSRQNVDAREVRIVLAPTRDLEDLSDRIWNLLGRVRKLELKSLAIPEPLSISYNCLQAA